MSGSGMILFFDDFLRRQKGAVRGMAPFLAYLSTDEANDINGAVFSVTGDGRVTLYSEPLEVSMIKKSDGPWSVEELIETVPKTLLKEYVSIVKSNIRR